MKNNNNFNKGKMKNDRRNCGCATSRITGRRVAQLMQSGASQAAINRVIDHGQKVMDLEKQLNTARRESSNSMRKDQLNAQADNL